MCLLPLSSAPSAACFLPPSSLASYLGEHRKALRFDQPGKKKFVFSRSIGTGHKEILGPVRNVSDSGGVSLALATAILTAGIQFLAVGTLLEPSADGFKKALLHLAAYRAWALCGHSLARPTHQRHSLEIEEHPVKDEAVHGHVHGLACQNGSFWAGFELLCVGMAHRLLLNCPLRQR